MNRGAATPRSLARAIALVALLPLFPILVWQDRSFAYTAAGEIRAGDEEDLSGEQPAPLTLPVPAGGSRPDLEAKLKMLVPRGRTGAPMPADVEITWRGRGILTGRLAVEVRDGRELLGQMESAELTLAPDSEAEPQVFQLWLPPATSSAFQIKAGYGTVAADLRFLAGRKTFDLGSFPIAVPGDRARTTVVGVGKSLGEMGEGARKIQASLYLSSLAPRTGRARVGGEGNEEAGREESALLTFPAVLPSESFPNHPLGYTAFDVVFLAGDGFARLKRKQVEALRVWLEAGGSLCLFLPAGTVLEGHHVSLLDAIAPPGERKFTVDADGRFRPDPAGDALFSIHPVELGRAVLLMATLEAEALGSPGWREAVAFLWKIRRSQLESVRADGTWEAPSAPRQDSKGRNLYRDYPRPQNYAPEPVDLGRGFVDSLLPKSVRLMPIWVMGLILGGFALAIGPGDYVLLGLFRARKLTWAVFPAVSIGVTIFTVWLAGRYLGHIESVEALRVIDVGARGQALRESRVEMVFSPREYARATRLDGVSFAFVDHRRYAGGPDLSQWGRPRRRGYSESLSDPDLDEEISVAAKPLFRGSPPSRYEVVQKVRKWTPTMNRITTLGPALGVPKFDWDGFAKGCGQGVTPENRGDPAGAYVFVEASSLTDSRILDSTKTADRDDGIRSLGQAVALLGNRPASGLFAIVSQISPGGGDSFEDLAILDGTRESDCMIVVVVPGADEIAMYRRLYRGGEGWRS